MRTNKKLPDRELNPGLPRDRQEYLPLYYRGCRDSAALPLLTLRSRRISALFLHFRSSSGVWISVVLGAHARLGLSLSVFKETCLILTVGLFGTRGIGSLMSRSGIWIWGNWRLWLLVSWDSHESLKHRIMTNHDFCLAWLGRDGNPDSGFSAKIASTFYALNDWSELFDS